MGKKIATRAAYGEALAKLGAVDPELVVLDADLSGSTMTKNFAKAYPDRFFNMGIAEAGMTACAAGMATAGKIPFVNTFAVFVTSLGLLPAREYGSYANINIKLCGAYGGMSDAYDGPTHHSIEDIAIMRSLPRFKVFVPCDAVQTDWVVKNAIEDPSPMYLRFSRDVFPDVYQPGETFEEGKGRVVRDGSDATVIACGIMVGLALQAAELLEKEGVSLRVVDMFCIKPLDKELVARCAKETGAIVTAEEHTVLGGLGGAVAEVLAWGGAGVPTEFVGLQDTFTESGKYADLLHKYGVDADGVIAGIEKVLARKK